MEVLVSQWLAVQDVHAVVDAIKSYWGSDPEPSKDELFTTARCNWEKARDDDAIKCFVLQVVACRLEDQLVEWLLQLHCADAADNIQKLFDTCQDAYFSTGAVELLGPMLDGILTAAVVHAAGCDSSAEQQRNERRKLLEVLEERVLSKTKAHGVVRALSGDMSDIDVFRQFVELPSTLDPRLFNSRSGRSFLDAAEQIVALQQSQLAAVCDALENRTRVNTDGKTRETAEMLWRLTDQIVKRIQEVAALDDSNGEAHGFAGTTTDSALPALVSMAGLDDFLKAKEPTALLTTDDLLSDDEMCSDDEDVQLSAMEQLSAALKSDEASISIELVENVFGELSTIKTSDVLTIHSSFLLSIQLRQKRCLVDKCSSLVSEFERRVRSVFNRLTGKAEDQQHAVSLVRLAAFCPQQVIKQMLHGARTDVQHHSLYLEVLRLLPLLLEWKEPADDNTEIYFERELQGVLVDIANNQNCFDRESQNVVAYLRAIVGIPTTKAAKCTSPLVSVGKLIRGILNPLFRANLTSRGDCVATSVQAQINLVTMIQPLFENFVATITNVGTEVDPAILRTMFGQVLMKLSSVASDVSKNGILLRERLLFLLKDILELTSDPGSVIMLEELNDPLDPSLWTLISLFSNTLDDYEHCIGKRDMLSVEAYAQRKKEEGCPLPVSLSTASNAAFAFLWKLLWSTALAGKESSGLQSRNNLWRCLDVIAANDFHETSVKSSQVKGSVLVEATVAKMMLVCGNALFQLLYNKIVPFLLEYDSPEAEKHHEDILVLPKWTMGILSQQPEHVSYLPCRLLSTHLIMRYVVKCWGVSTSVNTQHLTPKMEMLVESLSNVLGTLDKAVTSSQRELSGTLYCIQWFCFLAMAAFKLHLDTMQAWPTIRMQLDLILLRLLHQLDQLKAISTGEARFSQDFVAAWLVHIPVGHFEQTFNFLARRAST